MSGNQSEKITSGLTSLASNKTLQSLETLFVDCNSDDSNYKSFMKNLSLPNLKILRLDSKNITGESLLTLSENKGLPQLRELELTCEAIKKPEFIAFLRTPFAKRLAFIQLPKREWKEDQEIMDEARRSAFSFDKFYGENWIQKLKIMMENVQQLILFVGFLIHSKYKL